MVTHPRAQGLEGREAPMGAGQVVLRPCTPIHSRPGDEGEEGGLTSGPGQEKHRANFVPLNDLTTGVQKFSKNTRWKAKITKNLMPQESTQNLLWFAHNRQSKTTKIEF